MLVRFSDERTTLEKEEMSQKQSYELLIQDLTDSVERATKAKARGAPRRMGCYLVHFECSREFVVHFRVFYCRAKDRISGAPYRKMQSVHSCDAVLFVNSDPRPELRRAPGA